LLEPSHVQDMVRSVWLSLPDRFPHIALDSFVAMPNHVHGIIIIQQPSAGEPSETGRNEPNKIGGNEPNEIGRGGPCVRRWGGVEGQRVADGEPWADTRSAPTPTPPTPRTPLPLPTIPAFRTVPAHPPALGEIVQAFKSLTTVAYIKGVKTAGWSPFARHLWQRNYYERVIRNEDELDSVRQYIENNPARWDLDEENPARP